MGSCQSDQLRLLSKHRESLNGIIFHNLLPRPAILPSRLSLQQSVFLCECVECVDSEIKAQGLITWPCNCFAVSFWQLWSVQGSLQGCNSHLPYICYRVPTSPLPANNLFLVPQKQRRVCSKYCQEKRMRCALPPKGDYRMSRVN